MRIMNTHFKKVINLHSMLREPHNIEINSNPGINLRTEGQKT